MFSVSEGKKKHEVLDHNVLRHFNFFFLAIWGSAHISDVMSAVELLFYSPGKD